MTGDRYTFEAALAGWTRKRPNAGIGSNMDLQPNISRPRSTGWTNRPRMEVRL